MPFWFPPSRASWYGRDNVRAKYRRGIGSGGNVRAGQLTTLMGGALGVKAAINPEPASGGEDPERVVAREAGGNDRQRGNPHQGLRGYRGAAAAGREQPHRGDEALSSGNRFLTGLRLRFAFFSGYARLMERVEWKTKKLFGAPPPPER